VQGIAANWPALISSKSNWVAGRTVFPIAHGGIKRSSALPNTPTMVELAKGDFERKALAFYSLTTELGRILVAPPGVPAARLAAFRTAVKKTLVDPGFLADAKSRGLIVEPTNYPELEKNVALTLATPPEVVEQVKRSIGMK
jgi:tripartite-type tricarboxylate transporter receptor subunit TctC